MTEQDFLVIEDGETLLVSLTKIVWEEGAPSNLPGEYEANVTLYRAPWAKAAEDIEGQIIDAALEEAEMEHDCLMEHADAEILYTPRD